MCEQILKLINLNDKFIFSLFWSSSPIRTCNSRRNSPTERVLCVRTRRCRCHHHLRSTAPRTTAELTRRP